MEHIKHIHSPDFTDPMFAFEEPKTKIRYLSLFSGIEAFSCAVKDMPEFVPVAFAEIEPFPCAVLAHHYPNVKNLGDVTKIDGRSLRGSVDLIVGGSPCQGFSVAGLRKGLDDPRSSLAFSYIRLVEEIQPRYLLFENVPGILSCNHGQDFRSFLSALDDLNYSLAGAVLDSQWFGVPQRRRRMFVVGCAGTDWERPAKVFFESNCLQRNPPTRRKTGEGDSSSAEGGAGVGGERIAQNPTFATLCASGAGCDRPSAQGSQLDYLVMDCTAMREPRFYDNISPSLLKTLDHQQRIAVVRRGARCWPISLQNAIHKTGNPAGGCGIGDEGGPAFTMRADGGHPPAVGIVDEALILHDNNGNTCTLDIEKSPTLTTQQDKHAWCLGIKEGVKYVVRRITPVEAERLQGFPDGWTDVEFKGKPAPDTARYRALGNSMTVNVMAWIAKRILMVEKGEL